MVLAVLRRHAQGTATVRLPPLCRRIESEFRPSVQSVLFLDSGGAGALCQHPLCQLVRGSQVCPAFGETPEAVAEGSWVGKVSEDLEDPLLCRSQLFGLAPKPLSQGAIPGRKGVPAWSLMQIRISPGALLAIIRKFAVDTASLLKQYPAKG